MYECKMNWNHPGELAFPQKVAFRNADFLIQGSVDFIPPDQQNSLECNKIIEQRKNDEDFINNFLSDIQQRKKIESRGSSIKISQAKDSLQEIINQKLEVEKGICELAENDQDFECQWKALKSQINEINAKLMDFEVNVKTPLQGALNKRLKKRRAIKQRNCHYQSLKKLAEKRIEEKHTVIGKLLSEKSDEVEAIKREAVLKRQADTVLHEVRKKKYEAKKMLNLLTALAKLRELRSKEEEKQGGYCSKQLTETFNKVMTRFQGLWEKQMEVYKLEEKGLKIMLEENALPHIKESKFETNLLQWEKVLFGDITNDKNEKLLTIADSDIQALIAVRRDWDQFLTKEPTPMASSIPPGWILPPEAVDEEWKAFTKTAKSYEGQGENYHF